MPSWLSDFLSTVAGASVPFGYMILLAVWDNRSCRRKQDDAPDESSLKR